MTRDARPPDDFASTSFRVRKEVLFWDISSRNNQGPAPRWSQTVRPAGGGLASLADSGSEGSMAGGAG